MKNYRFPLTRYGYTFDQIIRIATQLALRTGRARLVWVNRRVRAHIIHEGVNGYRHIAKPDHSPNEAPMKLVGHVPAHDSIDWTMGALCELTPNCGESRPTPDHY